MRLFKVGGGKRKILVSVQKQPPVFKAEPLHEKPEVNLNEHLRRQRKSSLPQHGMLFNPAYAAHEIPVIPLPARPLVQNCRPSGRTSSRLRVRHE